MDDAQEVRPSDLDDAAATPAAHHAVVVVGGGQAGLAISYCLKAAGVSHVVLEQARVGHEWRDRRWDTFCLVTPNRQCRLPGFPYPGGDPHGFMSRDEIVDYVRAYAVSFDPPLREGVTVTGLRRHEGAFALSTSAGELTADQVVVATGGYHVPTIPRLAERLGPELEQLHSSEYRNPQSLPAGDVMVVGSGQSGCQIAEDLHRAGRGVHLCIGGAPRTARFYRGRDVTDWLEDMGRYDLPVDEHPLQERVRAQANHYVTGRDGGHDIDLRQFALEGMRLYGRLLAIEDGRARFAADLEQNLDHADEVYESINRSIDEHIEAKAIDAPQQARYRPPWRPGAPPRELDLVQAGVRSVVWSMGYRRDHRWIALPAFDGSGYPAHRRGVSDVAGLYFLGLPWLYTWGSGRFAGVARDAEFLAERIGDCVSQHPAPLHELALDVR